VGWPRVLWDAAWVPPTHAAWDTAWVPPTHAAWDTALSDDRIYVTARARSAKWVRRAEPHEIAGLPCCLQGGCQSLAPATKRAPGTLGIHDCWVPRVLCAGTPGTLSTPRALGTPGTLGTPRALGTPGTLVPRERWVVCYKGAACSS
jgi:hypothetical protein